MTPLQQQALANLAQMAHAFVDSQIATLQAALPQAQPEAQPEPQHIPIPDNICDYPDNQGE